MSAEGPHVPGYDMYVCVCALGIIALFMGV